MSITVLPRGRTVSPRAHQDRVRISRTTGSLLAAHHPPAWVVDTAVAAGAAGLGTVAWSLQTTLALGLVPAWPYVLRASGAHATPGPVRRSLSDLTRATVRAGALLALACWLLTALLGVPLTSAPLLGLLATATAGSVVVLAWEGARSSTRRAPTRVVLAGARSEVDAALPQLTAPATHLDVVGIVLRDGDDGSGLAVPAVPGLVRTALVAAELEAEAVVVLPGPGVDAGTVQQLGWQLEGRGVHLCLLTPLLDVAVSRTCIGQVDGLSMLHVDCPRSTGASRRSKRVFDIAASAGLIVALSPLLLVVAMVVKLHDGGPVLFSHPRIGRGGKPFPCFKFRTMVPGADSMIGELQAEAGADALLFKVKDDPRVTGPGRWMRRYSIDELPQLFNVLLGHMSLVGPRPQVAEEVEMYDETMRRRLLVRPGITGLWQVSGRSDLTLVQSRRLDVYYVDNWSAGLDASIFRRTVRAVLGSHGAY